jgi:hypothetical protein
VPPIVALLETLNADVEARVVAAKYDVVACVMVALTRVVSPVTPRVEPSDVAPAVTVKPPAVTVAPPVVTVRPVEAVTAPVKVEAPVTVSVPPVEMFEPTVVDAYAGVAIMATDKITDRVTEKKLFPKIFIL